jgi:CheY-like chemotaxis protein
MIGGLNVLPILLAVLVVILSVCGLILILALRPGGRRRDSEEAEDQRLVPPAPHTPDDGVNPQERKIYRAQPTPFATQPAPAAAFTPAPVPYQPQEPVGAPAFLPPPDPAPGAMDPLPPSPAPSFAFPPAPTTAAPPAPPAPPAPLPAADLAPAASAAPPVIPHPEPAPGERRLGWGRRREDGLRLRPRDGNGFRAYPPAPAQVRPAQPAIAAQAEAPPEGEAPEPSVPAPMAPQPAEPAAAVPAAPAPTPVGGAAAGQLILLVEDDEIAKFYSILFEAKGYVVRKARDGIEGVDLATTLKPALILLDVMMPKINGLMVLQKLRANPETEHTPVVVLSNYMEPPLIQRALQLGAIEYVVKSQARPEQLVNAVPSWLIGEPALH